MGPEETKDAILFMNGKAIGKIKDIQTVTLVPEEDSHIIHADLSLEHDFTCTFTSKFPHISRKHFIRNLQKFGATKKQAKEIAWKIQRSKISYGYASFLYSIGALPYQIHKGVIF